MRASSILAVAAAFASTTYAACLDAKDANKLANNFKTLIADYSDEFANKTLTVDFEDYSDSVIELINSGCTGPVSLGSATFDSRAAFESGQGAQPAIPFTILNVWHGCDSVTLRWSSTVSSGAPEQVTGIIVLETVPAPKSSSEDYLIKTVYSEFNSGAWLVDLGVFVPTCNSTSSKRWLRA